MKRRIVALALALSMLLAMLPVMPTTAYAAESTEQQNENCVLTIYCETIKETYPADSDGRIELSLEKALGPHDKTFLGWGDSPEGPVLYNVDDVLYLDQDKTIYGVHEEAKEIIDSCTETQPWMDLELKQYQCWFPNVLKFVPNATTSYCFERFAEDCVSHFALYSDVGSVLTSSTSNGNPDDIEYRLEYPLTAGEVYYVHFLRYDGSAESFRGRISRGFKITYDANGGSDAPEATYVYSNIDGNLSADIPTGTGTFLGWSTDPDAAVAEYAAGAAFPLRADTTLYAVWEAAECAHSFGQWYETEAPACMAEGTQRRDCANCDHFETQPIPATGHSFGEWYESVAATCTSEGQKRRDCANCDGYQTQKIPMTGHSYTAVVTAPTCTEGGYTTYTCVDCGDSYVADETAAAGHSWGQWYETKAPTTTAAGEERRDCANCDAYETRKVDPVTHEHSYTAVVTAPTCTEGGYTTYTCADCGDSYIGDEVAAVGHSWGEWTAVDEVTEIRTCSVCGEMESQVYTYSGTCGENAVWHLNAKTGKLTISGTGAMDGCGWEDLRDLVCTVEIEDGITSIKGFGSCDNLTSVTVADSVTVIGSESFKKCKSLTSIYIGTGVAEIGYCAFEYCDKLTDVYIKDIDAWTKIKYGYWRSCPLYSNTLSKKLYLNGIELTDIPAELTQIGAYSFAYCDGLTNVVIPDAVTEIGESAFEGCKNLSTVVMHDNLTSLGEAAFYGCSSLSEIVIPDSVTTLGGRVFYKCLNLKKVRLGKISKIHTKTFYGCTRLTDIVIPETVTYIGSYAFRSCKRLTSIEIPESVRSIGGNAFAYCEKLTEITLPNNLVKISNSTFAYSGITQIVIPSTVKTIEGNAFRGCSNLAEAVIDSEVTMLPWGVFRDCAGLTKVTLPDTLEKIDVSAFEGCSGLREIHIADLSAWLEMQYYKETGEYDDAGDYHERTYYYDTCEFDLLRCGSESKALYLNDALITELLIPEGVTELKEYRFANLGNLTSVTIPESVTKISASAFENCASITDVYYAGTEEQHAAIEIGDGNEYLNDAVWHYGAIHSHSYGEWIQTKAPTITEQGEETRYCNCGHSETRNVEKLYLRAPTVKISGNTTTGKPKLSWDAVSGADFYRIYRATSRTGTYKYHKSTTSTSYTDTEATAGTNYYYKIKAVVKDTEETSGWSNIVNRCCDLRKPVVTLKVDTASGKPKVTFEKISGTEKYYIVRATSKTGTYSKLASITGTSYIDTTAKAGKTYYYKVKALHENDAADSVYSDVTSRVCDLAKPAVSLSVNTATGKPVVKWETVSGAAKYRVYRSTSKDSGYELVYTAVSARTYTDKTAEAGTNYYYKVRAIHENADANSAYSKVVNRVCDLAKPVVSITRSDGDPKISWETVEGAEKYEIWRATSTYGTYKKVKTAISARSFTDTSAVAGKTYYYKVRAIHSNSAANSAYSAIKSITAK